jgi:hypothetical protein
MLTIKQAARSESKEEVISEGEERHDPSPPPWAERGEAKENTKDETNDTEDAEETKETGIPTVVDPRAKFAQKKADLLLLLDDIYDGMLFRKVG